MSKVINLTLYTKPGCHLCEEALVVVDMVVNQFKSRHNTELTFEKVNILDEPELLEQFAEEIPVLQINGETHAYWKVDASRLEKVLDLLA